MTETAGSGPTPQRFLRRLMVGGLGLWGASVGGALAPRALHVLLYPNHGDGPRFDLVAAQPLGAPLLWSGLVLWCLSWAFVIGYLSAAWAERRGRPSWAAPALLLLSLASPLVFALAVSVLPPLATREAFHGDGAVAFLPAVVVQLVVSMAYAVLTNWPPPRVDAAGPERTTPSRQIRSGAGRESRTSG